MSEAADHIEVHVRVEQPDDNAVNLLQLATGLPKKRIKLAMTQGAVWLTRGSSTKRLRRAKRLLQLGDEVHLYYDADILAEIPAEPILVADVDGYSVWRKPYGVRSQGSKWGDHCTVVRWAERHLKPERPAFTVHRLDRAASGLILVAHSKAMAKALSVLFSKRQIEKRYRAVVSGDLSRQPDPVRVDEPIDGKEAISEISFLGLSDAGDRSLVDVQIETGRKHQIRRHLSMLGHPVIGDRFYGTGKADNIDLQLTACLLAFDCPVSNKRVEYRLSAEWMPRLQ